MRRPHENVATVLVDPAVLEDLELALMSSDLHLWPVRTAPIVLDGRRREFQVRRQLLTSQRGEWDDAAAWVPAWVGFGDRWHHGDEPLPWSAHQALWATLDRYAAHVRFQRRLGGVPPMRVPVERHAS
ncbi:MAG: hypothetical protein FWE71_04025 [Nocardioidaceae bacterium]|nr:hypothetical protein [Nocardioidaceae bacterium]MCL2612602.1 hypothetical protein [Nocardioidaceae bacterium]